MYRVDEGISACRANKTSTKVYIRVFSLSASIAFSIGLIQLHGIQLLARADSDKIKS